MLPPVFRSTFWFAFLMERFRCSVYCLWLSASCLARWSLRMTFILVLALSSSAVTCFAVS